MSSDAKIAANRRNASKSSGPKTAMGKSKSKLNAVKTGIFSVIPILPGEDEAAYLQITKDHQERFEPAGPDEIMLMQQMVFEYWKLIRIMKADSALLNRLSEARTLRLMQSCSDPELDYLISLMEHGLGGKCNRPESEIPLPAIRLESGGPKSKLLVSEKAELEARLRQAFDADDTILESSGAFYRERPARVS